MYVSPPSFTKAISLWSSGVLNKSSPTTFTPVPVGGHRCARWRHYCRGAACEGTGAREQGAAPGQRNSEAGECFFCPGGARPPTQVLNDFVDKHRDIHGVEPICKVLQIAPSGYRRHAAQQRNPNLRGVRRGKVVRTTIGDMTAVRPLDRVNRQFKADRPSQLWVSDFTYASTWQGWQYVAFVIDVYARRIVGWRQSSSMRTDFVLDALEQALYDRQPQRDDALIHHSDRGSQYVSIRYSERLAEASIEPSVGSKGDSYDNALAETINGLYKTELIHRRAPWKTKESLELATLEWVSWFNHHRLLEPIGYIPHAEAEENYYRQLASQAAMSA